MLHVACEHPDGIRVLAATTLDVKDGKITLQLAEWKLIRVHFDLPGGMSGPERR